jgi:hypothetical protein
MAAESAAGAVQDLDLQVAHRQGWVWNAESAILQCIPRVVPTGVAKTLQ